MENYLPIINVTKGYRDGRNIYEGYQRGWGLQFGNLIDNIKNDPLYVEACRLIEKRSMVAEINRMNIFLIIKFYLPNIEKGNIVEFGAYRGGNAIFMAYLCKKLYPNVNVYAFDTFEGCPMVDKSVDAHSEGDFNDIDLNELDNYLKKIRLDNLFFIKGRFQDTAINILDKIKKVSLVHIDCDLFESVAYAYEVVKDYMVRYGYIIFDDANVSSCLGATEAVENFVIRKSNLNSEQIWPHFVFRSK